MYNDKILIAKTEISAWWDWVLPNKPYLLVPIAGGAVHRVEREDGGFCHIDIRGDQLTSGRPWEILNPSPSELEMLAMLYPNTDWSLVNG